MEHFFLFTKHLNDTGCLCLKISQMGELLAPLEQRNFEQIQTLQKECTTLIIEPATSVSLIDFNLPWLPERKARIAIPYALEDKVAQSVEELHFAFDKLRYHDNHYLITVISKQRMQYLMDFFNDQDIKFDVITVDWFALSPQELCVSESTLLINNDDFKGALTGELALTYLKNNPQHQPLIFQDSEIILDSSLPKNPDHSYTWIAQQILKTKPLNLCQGEMLQGNTSGWINKGYILSGVLCVIWLLSIIIVNAISLHFINKKTDNIDKQIAVIYHEFFPEAKQVISPKFRITQLIGNNTANSQVRFWFLLNQFAKTINDSTITVEQLRFQNTTLSVTVVCSDFASLEAIENKLRKLQLNVKQVQASTRDQHVVATLELT